MDEQETRKLIQEEINKYMNQKQYTYSKIPSHAHTGLDVSQVQESSLLPRPIWVTALTETVSETFTIVGVPNNIKNVVFTGIAYDSSATPPTKKATVTGQALFQNCFNFTGSGTTLYLKNGATFPLVQDSTSTYFDTSSLAKTRVVWVGNKFCHVQNDSAAEVASLTANSIINGVLSITSYVASNWVIEGKLLLS